MIFLFPRWDMLIPWRVSPSYNFPYANMPCFRWKSRCFCHLGSATWTFGPKRVLALGPNWGVVFPNVGGCGAFLVPKYIGRDEMVISSYHPWDWYIYPTIWLGFMICLVYMQLELLQSLPGLYKIWRYGLYYPEIINYQLMVNWGFGLVVWIPGNPVWKGLLLSGTPRFPDHRAPNHQFTISCISWYNHFDSPLWESPLFVTETMI